MIFKAFFFHIFLTLFCQAFASGIGGFKKGFLSSVYGTSKDGKGKSVEQSGSQSPKLIEKKMTNFAGEQQEKENVRIRVIYRKDDGASHASVVVGFYGRQRYGKGIRRYGTFYFSEYDFIRKCARRRKFRCEIDRELDEFDEKKDRPFKGDGLFVEKGKADQVFFEMSGRFWFKENYSYDTANCLDFIFNFVCALFDGKCPPKRIWPDNFVGFDIEMIRSRTYSHGVREPQSVFDRQPIILPGF